MARVKKNSIAIRKVCLKKAKGTGKKKKGDCAIKGYKVGNKSPNFRLKSQARKFQRKLKKKRAK